jgi:hypothetical protein
VDSFQGDLEVLADLRSVYCTRLQFGKLCKFFSGEPQYENTNLNKTTIRSPSFEPVPKIALLLQGSDRGECSAALRFAFNANLDLSTPFLPTASIRTNTFANQIRDASLSW